MFGFMKKKAPDAKPAANAKKSKGYYLELDEAKSVGSTPTPKTASPEASKVVSPEVAAPESVAPATAPTAAKVEKTPTPVAPVKVPEPAPEPKPVAVTKATPALAILPAYLQPTNTPRRRPGANMAMFRNMAQQVKTTKD